MSSRCPNALILSVRRLVLNLVPGYRFTTPLPASTLYLGNHESAWTEELLLICVLLVEYSAVFVGSPRPVVMDKDLSTATNQRHQLHWTEQNT
jgi:hypothetical protein